MTLKTIRYAVLSISALAALSFAVAAQAADCPTAKTLQDGFTLEKSSVKTEVLRGAGPITRVVHTYRDDRKDTLLYFRGLIELFRMTPESQAARFPLEDLGAVFPLKRGDRRSLEFVPTTPDKVPGRPWSLDLQVTGKEKLSLGECRYDVLVIKHVLKKGGRKVNAWTVLYSPELEMRLAKRYDEGTAREATVKYSNIQPLKR